MAEEKSTTSGQRWRVLVTALLAALLGIGAVWASPASALPTARVSLGDATGLEHSDAQAGLFVPLTLSETTTSPVTVTYWTNSGTATAGTDFLKWGTPNAPRTITIPAGSRQTTINVPVKPDGDNELPETFTVVLGSVTTKNATIDRGTGTGTIFDQLTNFLVSNVSVPEGDAPGLKAQFRVELVSPSTAPITLGYETSNGTATTGTDYTTVKPNVLKFLPGQTSKTIDVAINGNTTYQGDRTLQLVVAGVGSGTATILEDDAAPVTTTTEAPTTTTTVAPPQISNLFCEYGGFMSTCTITGSGFNGVRNISSLRGEPQMWGRNSPSQITLYLIGYQKGFYEFLLEPFSGPSQPFAVLL